MPQFSYARRSAFAGMLDRPFEVREIESKTNELKAQISTITLAGFGAGVYTVRLSQASTGREYDFSATSAGVSTNAIIVDLIAAIDAEPDTAGLLESTNSDPDLVLTFDHPGDAWTISFPSNPSGNMSVATTQAAGGTDIPLGRVLAFSGDFVSLPSGVADAALLGVSVRNANSAAVDYDNVPEYVPGSTVAVLTKGYAWVEVEDAVTEGGSVFVRVTATGTEELGRCRSDADGGDAIAMTSAKFKTSTSGAGIALVKIDR